MFIPMLPTLPAGSHSMRTTITNLILFLFITEQTPSGRRSTGPHNGGRDSMDGDYVIPRVTRPRAASASPPPPAYRARLDGDWIVTGPTPDNGGHSAPSGGASVWDLSLDVWDVEDRPPIMQDPR